MNKFTVTEDLGGKIIDENLPVLYNVYFGDKGFYYLHKSKDFKKGYTHFLDDIFRGVRKLNYPDYYKNVVEFCNKYPSLYKVRVELLANEEPGKLLKTEASLLKKISKDSFSLNNFELGQLKPEWMLRHTFKDKCEICPKTGIISNKKTSFNFCPVCGRSIKK